MADVDPEKILAELEAARLARQAKNGNGRNRTLLIGLILVLTLAVLALWVLSAVLDQVPRPSRNGEKAGVEASP